MSKEIPLTQGFTAIVDDEVYEWVSRLKWYAATRCDGIPYACRQKGRYRAYLAREIIKAESGQQVDHINGNTLDNRLANLRICTHRENCCNRRKPTGKSSRFKGVTWDKDLRQWRAMIRSNSKLIHLGSFHSETNAARAYDAAAREYFGDFARTNASIGLLGGQTN